MKEGTLGVTEMQEFIQQTAIQFPNDKLKVWCAISQCGKMKEITFTYKIFREIYSLIKTLLSRIFCQK